MTTDAAFSFESYKFDKVLIDFQNIGLNNLDVKFEPTGIFHKEESNFELQIKFIATTQESLLFVEIIAIANFAFENVNVLEEIPSFFYRNAIAIFFPYLRAYVSLVTNQAGHSAFILPTLNLSKLEEPLRANTIIK
ncbi:MULTISPECIES: protein-export chaperone SecB [unclassified Maribacter]|uniref:protein-export chaperone SecB n=1 Tax=unclassified Maribacter TaxID=2615042 RepID=UPI002579B5B6|nr:MULTISPECIES: protein-export chaperone SecB [unclassified Maribacter]|tara:strand:- start:152773 stop:153180 length:408 start_codon:yes stop_codon:yes gene_type:complete